MRNGRSLDIPTLCPPPLQWRPVELHSLLAPLIPQFAWPDITAVINDPQRATRSGDVLAALADLAPAGKPPRFRLLVACGTHRFPIDQQQQFEQNLRRSAGTAGRFIESVAWHDCRDKQLQKLAPDGQWRINPMCLDGEGVLLAIGSIEPHYFAGLTGAHKTATIGCTDLDAVQANHAGALSPASMPFALCGNPVHDGVEQMLRQLEARRPVAAVNLMQSGEELLSGAAGDAIGILTQLHADAEMAFSRAISRPADALLLEVSGPLGVSFYQAEKAIKNSENAVRDGGLLVLQAPCPDGIGQDHFVSLLRQANTYEQAIGLVLSRGYRLGDHKAVKLRRLTDPAQRGVRVAVVSDGLSAEDCHLLGLHKARTTEQALADCGLAAGKNDIYRVPDAANTVVRVTATH